MNDIKPQTMESHILEEGSSYGSAYAVSRPLRIGVHSMHISRVVDKVVLKESTAFLTTVRVNSFVQMATVQLQNMAVSLLSFLLVIVRIITIIVIIRIWDCGVLVSPSRPI